MNYLMFDHEDQQNLKQTLVFNQLDLLLLVYIMHCTLTTQPKTKLKKKKECYLCKNESAQQ